MSATATRIVAIATIIAASFTVAACSNGSDQTKAGETTSASPRHSSTVAPSASPQSKFDGIVIAHCFGRNGQMYVKLDNFDITSKTRTKTTTYKWPSTDQNTHSAIGGCARQTYNADFTKAFVSRANPTAGSEVIGYMNTLDPEGSFVQLSETPGEFDKIVDSYPSVAGGRVYYYDGTASYPALMSTKEDGTDKRNESALQKAFPDINAPEPGVGIDGNQPFVIGDIKPAVTTVKDVVAYSDNGQTSATFGTNADGKTTIDVTTNGQKTEYTLRGAAGFDSKIYGFLGADSLLLSEGRQIYRVDLSGGVAVSSVVLSNTNTAKEVDNVAISQDKSQLAFSYVTRGTSPKTDVYTMSVKGGTPNRLLSLEADTTFESVAVLQLP
jgi:hypothetical protein